MVSLLASCVTLETIVDLSVPLFMHLSGRKITASMV